MNTLRLWIGDIGQTFFSQDGWKMIARMFIVIGAVWGAIQTLLAFHTERLEKTIERTETAYYNFVTQFGSPMTRIRIGAISNASNVMLKRAPSSAKIGLSDAVKFTVGWAPVEKPVYHEEIKRLLYKYVRTLDEKNPNWSVLEMDEIVEALIHLGPEGWYLGEASSLTPIHTKGLRWIWGETKTEEDLYLPNIFVGVRLDSMNFNKFDLTNAVLNQAHLVGTQMTGSHILNGSFNGAQLLSANFEYAAIKFSHFVRSKISHTNFELAPVETTDFRYAVGVKSSFHKSVLIFCQFNSVALDSADFFHATLRHDDFSDGTLRNADFSEAEMDSVSFVGTKLERPDFSNAHIRNSNFHGADLQGAKLMNCEIVNSNFEGANLVGADFSGTQEFEKCIFWDANVFAARGLSKKMEKTLIAGGAVKIHPYSQWIAYKRAGRPHSSWRLFSK